MSRGASCVCSGMHSVLKAGGIIIRLLIFELSDHLEKGGFSYIKQRCIVSFLLFIIPAVFLGYRWAKTSISTNKYTLNTLWDIFYIISFLSLILLLNYFNFYSSAFRLFNISVFITLFFLLILDLKIDSYFEDLEMEE